jgi:hypothetical protein
MDSAPPTPSTVDGTQLIDVSNPYSAEYRVWTCELGEIGSSMVGFREGKDLLFDAIVDSCSEVGKDAASVLLVDDSIVVEAPPTAPDSGSMESTMGDVPIARPPGRLPPSI